MSLAVKKCWPALPMLCCALLWAAGWSGPAAYAQQSPAPSSTKSQLKQIEFEKAQVQRRLRNFRLTETEALNEIGTLSEQLREVKFRERHLIRRRNLQVRSSRSQEVKIRRLRKETAERHAKVKRHLRRLYRISKIGDSAQLMALVRHKDFFKHAHHLSLMITKDHQEIRDYGALNEKLVEARKRGAIAMTRLEQLELELKQEQSELAEGQHRLQNSLAQIKRDRNLYKKYLADLEDLRQGMGKTLVHLEQKKQQPTPAPSGKQPSLKGKLSAPVKGRIIATFGEQDPRYKLKKFQRGMVIRVKEAAPVYAVAQGSVVHAGVFRGYQQLVVLDHGEGLFSVYGHLEQLAVKRGGVISGGKPLGVATYQPVGKHYDVYFEIRWEGKAVDPLDWLKSASYPAQ